LFKIVLDSLRRFQRFLVEHSQVECYELRKWPYTGKIRSFTTMFCRNTCDRMQSPSTKAVNDRIFVRIPPYLSVYDTEIYDRNTITCKSSYFFVCGCLRPCLFDLGWSLLKIVFLLIYTRFIDNNEVNR
jgi:hypothetical protein